MPDMPGSVTLTDPEAEAVLPAPAPAPAPASPSERPASTPTTPSTPSGVSEENLPANLRALKAGLADKLDGLDPAAQKVILDRVAEFEKAFHKDKATVAEFKRFSEAVDKSGLSMDALHQLILTRGTATPPAAAPVPASTEAKGLSRLLAKATDADTREALREIQTALNEEVGTLMDAHPELKGLKQQRTQLAQTQAVSRLGDIDTSIDQLEQDYPSSLIEKYRGSLRKAATLPQFAGVSVEDILYKLATAKEIRDAAQHQRTTPPVTQKPTATPTVSTPAASDKELEPFKRKEGGWNMQGLIDHLTGKAMAKANG